MRPLLRWLLFHPRSAQAVTNIVSWRTEGIKYKKNEVFLDVVERLNLLVAANGSVLSSEILGAIKMRSFLSGMPELKLGLNDKALLEAQGSAAGKKGVEMEDIKFHQCVRLTRFESDRTISFIPPDGDFELMSYRLNTTVRACAVAVTDVLAVTLILPVQVKPLIWVEAVIETHGRSRVEYLVKAKSQFKTKSYANNVEVYIPVPADVDRPAFKASLGTVTYVPDLDAIKWTIKQVRARGPSASVAVSTRLDKLCLALVRCAQFHGGSDAVMRAHFGLPSVASDEPDADKWRKRSISVKFEMPYYTVSGIQVGWLLRAALVHLSGGRPLPRAACDAGQVSEHSREERLRGAALGAIHVSLCRARCCYLCSNVASASLVAVRKTATMSCECRRTAEPAWAAEMNPCSAPVLGEPPVASGSKLPSAFNWVRRPCVAQHERYAIRQSRRSSALVHQAFELALQKKKLFNACSFLGNRSFR